MKGSIKFEIYFKDLDLQEFSKELAKNGLDFDNVVKYENNVPVDFNYDFVGGEFEEATIKFYYHYEHETYWQPSHEEFEYLEIMVLIGDKDINIVNCMTQDFYDDIEKQNEINILYADSISCQLEEDF